MPRLFRSMKESDAGQPEIGANARSLGVRGGIDVVATEASEQVQPGTGGVSVSPDDPRNLPRHRRPPEFGGTGKDPVWVISDAELGPRLRYRPDPEVWGHGFVEPAHGMTLADYQAAVAETQCRWRSADEARQENESDDI